MSCMSDLGIDATVAIEYKWIRLSLSPTVGSPSRGLPLTSFPLFLSFLSKVFYFPLNPPSPLFSYSCFYTNEVFHVSGTCMGDTLRECFHLRGQVSPPGGGRMPAPLCIFHAS